MCLDCPPCRLVKESMVKERTLRAQEGEGWGRRVSCGYPRSRESVKLAFLHHFLQALSNQASQNQGHAMPSGTQHYDPSWQPQGKQLLWASSHVTHSHTNIPASQPNCTCRLESHEQPCPRRTPTHRSIGGGHGICQEWNGPESPPLSTVQG